LTQIKFDRVLCTGGSGRLGSYVVDALIGKCDLTVLDLKPPRQDVRHVDIDITDFESMKRILSDQDAVVHLAAIPNPRTAPADITFQVNVQGTWAVLEAAEQAGVRQVIVASSDAVTGLHYHPKNWRPRYLPIDEDHPLRPSEFYSLSKQVTEVICESYAQRGKLKIIVLRPTHIVFPVEWPELQERGADPRNYHLWSYVEPEDVAQAFALGLSVSDIKYEKFFISAADTLALRPTLELMEQLLGYLPRIRRPDLYAANPTAAVWDIRRARERLNFEPVSNWRRLAAQ